jgi:hypothetical protein
MSIGRHFLKKNRGVNCTSNIDESIYNMVDYIKD